MRNILAARNRPHLRRFAARDALVAFDFDGTLAPIVDKPVDAIIGAETASLLDEVARRYPVAVISGRTVADVTARLREARVATVIGNHGIEPSSSMHEAAAAVRVWAPILAAELAGLDGVMVEDKHLSVSVHFRHAPSPNRARRTIHEAVARLPGAVRVVDGHMVVNLVLDGAPNKGDALRTLAARFDATAVLFTGDDVTDEDAFAVLTDDISFGVRVCRTRRSHARWYVPSQGDVDRLLAELLAARRG